MRITTTGTAKGRYVADPKSPQTHLASFPKGHKPGRIPRVIICEACWQAIKPQVGWKIHSQTCPGAK